MTRSGLVGVLALLATLVLIVVLAGQAGSDGPALDPESSGELGTRALVELLDEFGRARVSDGIGDAATDTAILLTPVESEDGADEIHEWVERGGRLVVFADFAPLAAPRGGSFTGDVERGLCDIEALVDVETLDLSGGTNLAVGPGDRSCFGDGRQALIVASDLGEGTVITVGSSTPFVNRHLDDADHAVLAVALLTPSGDTNTALVRIRLELDGGRSSLELLGPAFDRSVWQALVAFVLLAIATAIRFGRPVGEAMPARIAGSELVAAVGGLMSDAGEPAPAAAILRTDAREDLCRLCSVERSIPDEALARLVAARTDHEEPAVLAALVGSVESDDALVRTARILDDLRRESRHLQGETR